MRPVATGKEYLKKKNREGNNGERRNETNRT